MAKQAATVSLFAPLISIGIGIFVQPQFRENRLATIMVGSLQMLLILSGFVLGIGALVSAKRHGC